MAANNQQQQQRQRQQQIDADVMDNWEDVEECEDFERKFDQFIPKSSAEMHHHHQNECSSSSSSLKGGPVNVVLVGEEALRSQYVPPEPTVKILKRPRGGDDAASMAANSASACAYSGPAFLLNGDSSRPRQPVKTLQQREQEYAEARLRILGSEADHANNQSKVMLSGRSNININSGGGSQQEQGVLRMPRGPDGSRGFVNAAPR